MFLFWFPKRIVTLTLLLHLFLRLLVKPYNIRKLDLRLCCFFVFVAYILWSARIRLYTHLCLYNSFFFLINPWTGEKANFPFYFPLWRNLVLLNCFKCEFHWNKIIFYARRDTGLFSLTLIFKNICNGKIPLRNTKGIHVISTVNRAAQMAQTPSFLPSGRICMDRYGGRFSDKQLEVPILHIYPAARSEVLLSWFARSVLVPCSQRRRSCWKDRGFFSGPPSSTIWWKPRQLLSSWATCQTRFQQATSGSMNHFFYW